MYDKTPLYIPARFCIVVHTPVIPIFLQDGHDPPWCFFATWTDPDPLKMSLTCMWLWFLARYIVHVVKLGNKVFYANCVCVFIDIDQLKGKLMQNLVKNKIEWAKFWAIPWACQRVWIQIKNEIWLVQILLWAVCKGYQYMRLACKEAFVVRTCWKKLFVSRHM